MRQALAKIHVKKSWCDAKRAKIRTAQGHISINFTVQPIKVKHLILMSEQTRKQFDELKAKHPDAVLLFNVGDFYETYYDDAKTVSDVCGLTLTRVDSTFHYKEPAYMCGFPRHALDTYLPKLVRAGVRVAICDQLSKTPAPEPTTSQTLNSTEMERTIQNIPMSEIVPSPRNPRKNFDEEALQELADNIKHQGLLQPITIRPIEWKEEEQSTGVGYTPNKYEIVCGERRWRAVKLNESETIPCIVRELDDATAYEVMITENLQRKDIDPMEEAFAFAELIKTGKAADEIAQYLSQIYPQQSQCKSFRRLGEEVERIGDAVCKTAEYEYGHAKQQRQKLLVPPEHYCGSHDKSAPYRQQHTCDGTFVHPGRYDVSRQVR